MNINSIGGLTLPASLSAHKSAGTNESKTSSKTKDAAQQFEALMIGQLLKSARGDGDSGGWLGAGEDDQTGQTAVDYAEQQMASLMAKNGGIGLTKFITQTLDKKP